MGKQLGKKLILFLVVAVSYCGLFSWQLLAFKKFHYDWAAIAGIVLAVCYSMADRFLKWVDTPEFRSSKLVKPFIITLIIYIPIIMFVILPGLDLPCGVWLVDSFVAFFTTCFFLNNASTTAITKTYERLEKIVKPSPAPPPKEKDSTVDPFEPFTD